MRGSAKTFIERTLLHLAGAPFVARDQGSRRVVLGYHNVVPDDSAGIGDQSLHISVSRFRSHLAALEERCFVTDLHSLLTGAEDRSGRPMVAITFDDAYQGAVTIASRELADRGMPATFFVCPGAVGTRAFWWDRIAAASRGAVRRDWRAQMLLAMEGDAQAILNWAGPRAAHEDAIPAPAAPCGEEELYALTKSAGMTLGSHAWSHRNLTALSAHDLRDELRSSHEWLARFGASYVPVLAYPYGLWSPGVAEAVRDAGYLAALRIDGGMFRVPLERPFATPRMNVPSGLSADGLALRLLGMRRA